MKVWQSRQASAVAAAILFAGALAIGIPLGGRNKAEVAKYGYAFPDLQDARKPEKAQAILETWNTTGANDDIRKSMQLDLAFPLFYASLLALLAYRASLDPTIPKLARLGRWCAAGALVGGLADLVENGMMLAMLGDPGRATWLYLLLVFVFTKIAGAAAAVLYTFSVRSTR